MKRLILYYPQIDYFYDHDIEAKDIIEYLWSKSYDVVFNETTYMLEPDGMETYRIIEKQYLKNEIDEDSIIKSEDFYEFCVAKYKDAAYEEYGSDWLDELEDPEE